jgi:N-methylhydantoinase B/oxoprolinase/acetone carboxylase alpha subunit
LLNGRELPGAAAFTVEAGDELTLLTPGGGGYGRAR